jgi:hypothetical protein
VASRRSERALAALAAAVVLAAAGGAAPGSAARQRIRAGTQLVSVTLREYAIVLPRRLRPGRTTFVLHNRGRFPHNFTTLFGPVRFHSPTVLPGATRRLTVTLVPGAYVVACTLLNGGHLAMGMLTLFTIGSRAHGSGVWHYP